MRRRRPTPLVQCITLLGKGGSQYDRGHYAQAKHHWARLVKLQPAWPLAWYNLGLAYARMGKAAMALKMLQRALELDHTFLEASVERALIYDERGQRRQAKQEYARAFRLAPMSPIVNYNLGSFLFDQGRYAKALVYFRRAIRVNPTHAPSHDYLGQVAGKQRRWGAAVRAHARAATLEPWETRFMNNLGYALFEMGEIDKALRCFNHAVALDRKNHVAYYNRALAHYAKRDVAGVVQNLRMAIRYNPANRSYLRHSTDFKEFRNHVLFRRLLGKVK